MKDDDLFWHFEDFFGHFPPCHQLTMVAKHAFNPEYAVNFGPASGGPTEAHHVLRGSLRNKQTKRNHGGSPAAPIFRRSTAQNSKRATITRSREVAHSSISFLKVDRSLAQLRAPTTSATTVGKKMALIGFVA